MALEMVKIYVGFIVHLLRCCQLLLNSYAWIFFIIITPEPFGKKILDVSTELQL